MTGAKVNNYSIGDANIQELMLTSDKLIKGYHKVSLTNYDTTSESQIAAGSVVECGGALYKFDSNETITGSPSDGTVYIMIVPGLTTCTAVYTNTAPTWNDSYQGFYGTGGSAGYRYLEFTLYKTSAVWNIKDTFNKNKKTYIRATLSGAQTVSSASATTIALDTESNDLFSQFDTTNNSFKVLRSGSYLFNIKLRLGNITTESFTLLFLINGSAVLLDQYSDVVVANDRIQTIVTKKLAAGEVVKFQIASELDTSYVINYLGSIVDIIEL